LWYNFGAPSVAQKQRPFVGKNLTPTKIMWYNFGAKNKPQLIFCPLKKPLTGLISCGSQHCNMRPNNLTSQRVIQTACQELNLTHSRSNRDNLAGDTVTGLHIDQFLADGRGFGKLFHGSSSVVCCDGVIIYQKSGQAK
jgi:hypothetical protein